MCFCVICGFICKRRSQLKTATVEVVAKRRLHRSVTHDLFYFLSGHTETRSSCIRAVLAYSFMIAKWKSGSSISPNSLEAQWWQMLLFSDNFILLSLNSPRAFEKCIRHFAGKLRSKRFSLNLRICLAVEEEKPEKNVALCISVLFVLRKFLNMINYTARFISHYNKLTNRQGIHQYLEYLAHFFTAWPKNVKTRL